MASVERPTYTVPVPAGATVREGQGGRYATWKDSRGRAVRARVLDSGRCLRQVAGKWYGVYRDHAGKKCKTRSYGTKFAALAAAVEAEKRAKAVKDGRDVPAPVPGRVTLTRHVTDYLSYLELERATGRKRRAEVGRILNDILDRHKLTTPAAVDCDSLARRLEEDRQAGKAADIKGGTPAGVYSYRTRNLWVATLRAFGRWLARTRRVHLNPFDGLATVNDEPHKTRTRRAIPVAELEALIDTAAASPVQVMGLPGPDRAMMYVLAAHTGLRAAALLRLTPEAFTWEGGEPVAVFSSARLQKNKSAHGISLVPPIRAMVGAWLASRPPGERVLPAFASARTADMLRHDLEAARVAWVAAGNTEAERRTRDRSNALKFTDAAGQVFDFHSLRVQTGYMLAAGGVSLAAAQQILDHSNPKLTAAIYSKFGGELGAEMAKMRTLPRLAPRPLGTVLGTRGVDSCGTECAEVNGRTGG